MENGEFAAALRELADLLEFEEAELPRVAAYRKAAASIEACAEDVERLAREGRLETLPGVGPWVSRLLGELARTGRLAALDDARDRLPRGVRDVIALPGVGPRRAARFLAVARVASLSDLDRALRDGKLAHAGVASADLETIARSLELARLGAGARPLGYVLPRARAIAERLASLPDVLRVRIAGEVRRGRGIVGELALAAAAESPEALLAAFRADPHVRLVLPPPAPGAARVAIDEGLVVVLHAAAPAAFGGTLWRATGHARHVEQVEAILSRPRRGERPAAPREFEDERDVYEAARLAFVPPELREGRGEVEAAREGRLPRVVEAEELEGDLRVQSDFTGGAHPPERLAAAAASAGLRWLAVVDPARGPRRPSGLDADRAARRAEALAAARPAVPCGLVAGVEAPVAQGGVLEADPAVLAGAELRIAVLDPGGPLAACSRAERTAAVVRVLLEREADLVALAPDPTGSPRGGADLGQALGEGGADAPAEGRAGVRPLAAFVDLGAILAAASSAGAGLLVPAHAAGGLLGPADLRRAAALHVPLALGSGARAVQEMWSLEIGVALVRRAGLGREALLNTRTEAELRAWLAARRGARP
ncbi:MAG TPA: hypothetical protein VF406_07915 [Thermodesulfobacteriota bacterium]